MDRYQYLGLALISFGLVFGVYSYMVLLSAPLTALGLGCIILGSTMLMIPPNPMPVQHVRAMMEASLVNIEAVLEEFDVKGRSVYVSSEGRVYAFTPVEDVEVNLRPRLTPLRVLSDAGGVPGVNVFPPGSEAVRLALLPEEVGVEDALTHVLVDFLEEVESLKMVQDRGRILVEFSKPRTVTTFPRVRRSLGSAPVSVAACVLAQVTGQPVRLISVEEAGDRTMAVFQVGQGSG